MRLIYRKRKNFIWGDTENHRHMHLASWNSICTPKKFGDLGLRYARDMITSFMTKAGWNLCARKNDMWVKILRSKYKCGMDMVPIVKIDRQRSNFWRGIYKNWSLVDENLAWKVGNGVSVKFWTDCWIPKVGRLAGIVNEQMN